MELSEEEKKEAHDMMELWEDNVLARYPEQSKKQKEDFRNYDNPTRDTVREFYKQNHQYQTYGFVLEKEKEFLALDRKKMTLWEAVEYLNTLVDDSDPGIDLDQTQHLLQTSEAIRADGHPDWFILTGFLHDLGKVLCLFGEPQWAVVGDTFPVGCKFSDKIVYPEFFKSNPDTQDERFNTLLGVYEEHCGLNNVHMSWGHDEYIYHIMKDHLPEEGLYMLRYHSFYAQHREKSYDHLMSKHDHEMFEWVQKFNVYDLYTKAPERPDVEKLRPYYEDLASKYLPDVLRF
ncbi:MAG: inositol oxygenase [Cyclobacteriaceae bacterium]|nr:inositol oxygenase [Cyclobacteriaceae bacterium HetDA_MAG_MS6]